MIYIILLTRRLSREKDRSHFCESSTEGNEGATGFPQTMVEPGFRFGSEAQIHHIKLSH
jgi:hypothetical protein